LKNHMMMGGMVKPKTGIPGYVFDIETDGLDATKLAFAVIMSIETHDFTVLWSWDEVRGMLKQMSDEQPFTLWAHNGWKYDFLGLFSIDQIKQAKKLDSKGRIIMAEIDGFTARDFKHLVPCSLSEIGEALGYPKGETPLKFIEGRVEEEGINQQDIDYCVQDCLILAHAITSLETTYSEWCGSDITLELPFTSASMAYKVWSQSSWPSTWTITSKKTGDELNMVFCKPEFNDALRDAYYGGRNQVMCDPGERIENVMVLDRNAMYPAEMEKEDYPDMRTCRKALPSASVLRAILDSEDVVGWANISLEGYGLPTFLPGTDDLGRRCWTMPYYEGWLCEPEIRHALELGYTLKEVKEVHYAQAISPFKWFMRFFYDARREMRERGDGRQLWIKTMMAALYGKFGQKPIAERVENDERIEDILEGPDSEKYEIKYYDGAEGSLPYLIGWDAIRKSRNTWFGFCAFCTSYARVSLNKAIMACDAIYTDTDSVFFESKNLGRLLLEIPIGDDLGEWDFEVEEPTAFIAWEPKSYVFLEGEEKVKVRHKGATTTDSRGRFLPWAGDLTQQQVQNSVVQYRQAMRHGLLLGSGITKFLRSHRHYGNESPFTKQG